MSYDALFPKTLYPYVAKHKDWIQAEVCKRCRTLRRRYDGLLVDATQIACRSHASNGFGARFSSALPRYGAHPCVILVRTLRSKGPGPDSPAGSLPVAPETS
jgi:hypothetical protein